MTRGRPIAAGPFRGEIAEPYAAPGMLDALRDPAALASLPGAEVLLAGRNTVVALPGIAGLPPLVLKIFRTRGPRRLESLARASKAARAWRGAWILLEAGLETPAPAAWLERRRGGAVVESYFLAERIEGAPEIRGLLRSLPDAELEPLLSALAGTLAAAHARGVFHRDLSDGNVLVRRGADGGFRFVFLDTNRVRSRRALGTAARARNLVRLGVPPRLRSVFLAAYARSAGAAVRPALLARSYALAKGTFAGWLRAKRALRLRRIAKFLRIQ